MSDTPAPPSRPPSLAEVHESVELPQGPGWRRWLAIAGPALMVSVGYMDPGNWATDLAGGSRYGYALLWVLLMSNLGGATWRRPTASTTRAGSTSPSTAWPRSRSPRPTWPR